jgi:hypothetical protein
LALGVAPAESQIAATARAGTLRHHCGATMDLDARLLPGKPSMRSVARRIRLNSICLLLSRLTMLVQLVVFTVLVARYLGVAGFGQYAFVAALIYLGNVATTFGTDTLLIREVARRQPADDALVTAALWLQLTLSVAWLIVVAIGTGVLSSQSTEVFAALKVYSLSLIPLAFYTVFTAVLRYTSAWTYTCCSTWPSLSSSQAERGGCYKPAAHCFLCDHVSVMQLLAAIFAGMLCYRGLPLFD